MKTDRRSPPTISGTPPWALSGEKCSTEPRSTQGAVGLTVARPVACPANRISHSQSEPLPDRNLRADRRRPGGESVSRGCSAPRRICPDLVVKGVSQVPPSRTSVGGATGTWPALNGNVITAFIAVKQYLVAPHDFLTCNHRAKRGHGPGCYRERALNDKQAQVLRVFSELGAGNWNGWLQLYRLVDCPK
jgi:hypothetical protein